MLVFFDVFDCGMIFEMIPFQLYRYIEITTVFSQLLHFLQPQESHIEVPHIEP